MPSAPSGACPSADARRNRASRLSTFFYPASGHPMGWVPAFSRLSPGIPLFARPPDLTCMSGGRVAFRHRSFPAPPLLGGCRAAEARFPSVEADLQDRSRSVTNLHPRGCISVSARLQVCIRAGTSLYPRGCKKLPVRVPVFIRADTPLHPCRCDFASRRVRLCIRADASLHPCGCDFSSGQIQGNTRRAALAHPCGCKSFSL